MSGVTSVTWVTWVTLDLRQASVPTIWRVIRRQALSVPSRATLTQGEHGDDGSAVPRR